MKRILVSSAIIMLMLIIPLTARETDISNRYHQQSLDEPGRNSLALADVGDTGEDAASTLFMSRTFSDLQLSILNSYNAPDHHNDTLDLTQYHIPGWTLYQVNMDIENSTAALEREVVGVTHQTDDFKIYKVSPSPLIYVNALTQGFYNRPHDGNLLNYSINYKTFGYGAPAYGFAFFVIQSSYTDFTTNQTSQVNVTSKDNYEWVTLSGENANLTKNVVYWSMVNGTNLIDVSGNYPSIHWSSESSQGSFYSDVHINTAWSGTNQDFEGLYNYTYIPWNQTSNTALTFQPQTIKLRANSTPITETSWTWSSSDNITQINFDSNQSVYAFHNLTLWYKRSATAQTNWNISTPGGNVVWNQTLITSYPSIAGIDTRYVNFTRMTDWTPEGLYNGTTITNHDNYTVIGTVVRCANMTNGTWTLRFLAPNYVKFVDTYDSFDASEIQEAANILVDMDINSTISDGAILASTGFTNLTVYHEGASVYKPLNESVATGKTHYLWDISFHSDNGTFTIEIYWTNGTEAGYLAKEVVVFYPTTLEATDYGIDAYTDDNFNISAYYNDTFTPQALTSAFAVVKYSFDGGANITMIDLGNGWWNATILTTAKAPGTYSVAVYAEGFAIENQTAVIWVTLIHETLPLTCVWSEPYQNNITYVEQTNLTVQYQLVTAAANVTDASVNVTIAGMGTWQLHYDPASEIYWMQFNGSDFTTGFSEFTLNVSAWKTGHLAQFNDTLSLTVRLAPTTMTLDWSSTTIDYLGQIDLTVNYTCDETGSPVPAAPSNMNISINGGTPVAMTASGSYWIANLTGVFLDLGTHSVEVQAWAYGYVHQTNDTYFLTVNNVTTNELTIIWDPANVTIPYISRLNLTVDYTYGSNDVPLTANVNVTINGHTYDLYYSAGVWHGSIPGNEVDTGLWEATVHAWLYGYESQINVTLNINITLAPNSFIVEWAPSGLNVTYVETVHINVTYTHDNVPILGATVQLIISGTRTHNLTYNSTTEKWHISLLGSEFGLGVWNATIHANKTGYDPGTDMTNVTINPDPCTATPNWTSEQLFFTHQIDLNITLLDSLSQPVADAVVNATYDGSNHTLVHLESGVYRLVLNGSDGLGDYGITIHTFGYGLFNRTLSLSLQIVSTPTMAALHTRIGGYSSSIMYHDGWIIYSLYFVDVDSLPLPLATVNLTIGLDTFDMISHGNGTFTLNQTASEFLPGTYSGTILADIHGYEAHSVPFSIDVEPVPAHIEVSLGVVPSVMFLNDSVIIRFDYINNHTGTRIADASPRVFIWANDLAEQRIDTGRFEVTISSLSLTLTDHVLNITLGHINYTTAQFVRVINVRPVNTRFTTPSSFGQYENETVILAVNFTDVDHGEFIHWASVNATIEGAVFQMEYTGEGIYALNLHITWAPGTYQISFAASAVGCASNSTTAQLAVSEKVTVYLTLSVIGASEGQSAQISAILRENNTENPIHGRTIYYEITIVFTNGTVLVDEEIYAFPTNNEGIASFAYLIPASVDYLEIAARFDGTTSIWGTNTFLSAPVSPGILAMVMTFILTPPGMYIVLGFVVVAVVSAFYQKRVKPKRRAAMNLLERQLQDFADLETLRHFMAVYLDRGTCVFYHPFAEERIQPDLISGFIAAITSVYGEIKGDGVRGTLEEIQYHGLRLNSYSGKYVIGILILEGEMTKLLRERLQFFIEMFEKHHEVYLEDWDGLVDCFDPEWVVSNLIGTFNYTVLLPHKFGKKRKVSKLDGKILDLIGTRRDNRREFNLRDLITPVAALMGASDAKALDRLLAMEDKGLIEPIGTQTVLQRQGLGLANGEDETITAPVSIPTPKSPSKVKPLKPAEKKIDAQDMDDIIPEHEPIKPQEGTGKPDPGKPRFIDETKAKDIDKSSPKLASTAKAKETEAKPAKKKKVPKKELSEADKFLTEVIILLAKEKKKEDKSD